MDDQIAGFRCSPPLQLQRHGLRSLAYALISELRHQRLHIGSQRHFDT